MYTVFSSHDVCPVVGESGQVLSFEQREDHLRMARRNYQTWQLSASLHRSHSADNVLFFNCSVTEAPQHTHTPVDAVRDPYLYDSWVVYNKRKELFLLSKLTRSNV